ncbi:hypothetical protein [Bradyrhizobium sp. YR681]|uniref:hypothetical protein n=1 Tax=Bradyrhizobium sp. YR681 TaxID=1144344 RepID=UPI00055AF506|nr:hypothetical protein [Bradyrhizobium sp. YR681]
MSESSQRGAASASASEEQSCKFGTVVRALWPVKPALNLAQRTGLTERGAQYLIDGKRKPNARAALAVYAEIIS